MTALDQTSINVIDLRHLVPHPIAHLSTQHSLCVCVWAEPIATPRLPAWKDFASSRYFAVVGWLEDCGVTL